MESGLCCMVEMMESQVWTNDQRLVSSILFRIGSMSQTSNVSILGSFRVSQTSNVSILGSFRVGSNVGNAQRTTKPEIPNRRVIISLHFL